MKKIILASKSPRRKAILEMLGLEFECQDSKFNESLIKHNDPKTLVQLLSKEKAQSIVQKTNEPSLIIGCDTIVVMNNIIMGKPNSKEEAFQTLLTLSGKKHIVFSGITIIDTEINRKYITYEQTDVFMRSYNHAEINAYLKTNEYVDKAGAYGIQGMGSLLVKKINGNFYNVMGFPIVSFYTALNELSYNLFDLIKI